MSAAADAPIEFEAVLEHDPARGEVVVVLPPAVAEQLAGVVNVAATLDGFPFRAELRALPEGDLALDLPRPVRRAVSKTLGDVARLSLAPDLAERLVAMPADLAAALDENPAALAFFKKLDLVDQRDYVRYLAGAKSPDLRARRLQETVYRLSTGRKRG